MRSQLSNEIFRDELLSLYQQKDLSYSQVRDAATEAMGRLIREMETGLCHSPVIAEQMETLAGMLEDHKGKKVYGYLKKPAKAQVDAIVDELAKVPEVAECYEQWNQLRDELERYYKDVPREHLPLSQQKEFKAIKNMVIREAERLRLGTVTFEDARMRGTRWMRTRMRCTSPGTPTGRWPKSTRVPRKCWRSTKIRRVKKRNRCGCWNSSGERFLPGRLPTGQVLADGRGVLPDDEQAELWFRRAADAGYDFAQYALGKLLQSQNRAGEAVSWYEKAAAQENTWAAYRLGKLYLEGKDVPERRAKAVAYLTTPPNTETSMPSIFWESCTSPDRMSNRTESRPGRISMNRRNRETSTPTSFWSTSIRRAGPMCSCRPPDCSTTWARSSGKLGASRRSGGTAGWTESCGGKSRKRRSPWATSRMTMRETPRQDMGGMTMGGGSNRQRNRSKKCC